MRVLITAGPTYEHIDPVRFIGNMSSGKQGICLANEALKRGHEVILVLGPTHYKRSSVDKLTVINVVSADEMYNASVDNFPACDVAICSAAVADYRPAIRANEKIKRTTDTMTIELVPNQDIAKKLGEMKTSEQILVGFALETNNVEENARLKIVKKNLDFVVMNQTTTDNPAFGSNINRVSLIDKDGTIQSVEQTTKENIASIILDKCNL